MRDIDDLDQQLEDAERVWDEFVDFARECMAIDAVDEKTSALAESIEGNEDSQLSPCRRDRYDNLVSRCHHLKKFAAKLDTALTCDFKNSNWPPDPGWHYRDGRIAFANEIVDVPGKLVPLAEKLANAKRWVLLDELLAGKDGEELRQSTVTSYISEFNKLIRKEWGLPNIVSAIIGEGRSPRRYRLDPEMDSSA